MNADHSEDSQFFPGLIATLEILEPYLDSLVLAGGWVPYLYHHYLKRSVEERAPLTQDIDFVTPRKIPVQGKSIDIVLREAGLMCEFRSRDDLPPTVYSGKIDNHDAEVEFLTIAPGHSEDVVTVQPGLTAQSLHYLDILNEYTWAIEIDTGKDGVPSLRVLIPTPGAFIVHKGIVYRKRREDVKRAKDLFYLFHILAIYGEEWGNWIREDLAELVHQYPAWLKRMRNTLKEDLSSIESDSIKAIVSQRPADFLIELNDDQLAQYIFTTILGFVDTVSQIIDHRATSPT